MSSRPRAVTHAVPQVRHAVLALEDPHPLELNVLRIWAKARRAVDEDRHPVVVIAAQPPAGSKVPAPAP
jgi:hypothetical protein